MIQLAQVFALCTLVTLAAAIPLSLIAVAGFRDAPFGAVLKPVPVVFGAYFLLNAAAVLEVDVTVGGYLVLSTVAVVAALFSAVNATLLLTERRAL